ncbi:Pectinesterase inhibitor [Quillaja saponaria]|uniref:Pectinesterase inhibitor n=1 Tax=Quillaja saponaria TaxID=32244 RepID=A0AAD7QBG0_QUISA|nr:Pectinesterase inhibitor [Quillaja saponaria]
MASFTFIYSSVSILLSLFLLFSQSKGVPQDVLSTICSQTQNQKICESILTKDPRTSSADLPLLSLISLEITSKQVDNNFNTFKQFRDNTTNLSVKNAFGKCVTIYQQLQDKVKVAHQLSEHKKYKEINGLGQLKTLAYACENGLPSDSPTSAITEDMLLTSETAISVNDYVATSLS